MQTREESEKLRKENDGLETERRQITALKKDAKERHIAPLWTQWGSVQTAMQFGDTFPSLLPGLTLSDCHI